MLEAAQILTRLCPLSSVDLGPIHTPSDFILRKGKLSVYFYREEQSIKLISSYLSSHICQ